MSVYDLLHPYTVQDKRVLPVCIVLMLDCTMAGFTSVDMFEISGV